MRAILTYHSIDASGSPISCHPDTFDRHVTWLASRRVRVTTIDELVRLPDETDAVAITFDDGFVNFEDVAAPRLLERAWPVTLFVVADLVGGRNVWDAGPGRQSPDLPLLDWPSLIRLQEQGVTLGGHSRTHASLSGLSAAQLEDEVQGCADVLEARAGRRPDVFAYPFGDRDAASTRAVAARYRWACTTDYHALPETPEPAALPRLDMFYFQKPASLEAWGTARFKARINIRHRLRQLRKTAAGRKR